MEGTGALEVPASLRSADKKGYVYSHEGEKGWLPQEYFPVGVKTRKYYEPTERGFEKTIKQFLIWLKS